MGRRKSDCIVHQPPADGQALNFEPDDRGGGGRRGRHPGYGGPSKPIGHEELRTLISSRNGRVGSAIDS